jgi:hypothetical protein
MAKQPTAFAGTGIYNTAFLRASQDGKLINLVGREWVKQFVQLAAQLLSPVSLTPPATAASPGVAGQIATDGNFIYIAVAKNTWKRFAIATF